MADRQHERNLLKKQSRLWFDFAHMINLNAGSTSPTPKPVLQTAEMWRQRLAADPVEVIWLTILQAIEQSRGALATWLNADAKRLLLFTSTTLAINTVIQTKNWRTGDEVLLTDLEYHHYLPLWERIASRCGIRLKTIKLPLSTDASPDHIVESFRNAISDRTRLIFCSHVTSTTGLVLPIAAISRLARDRNIETLIDGAHAPGLVSINLDELDCDFYAGNINKWLMGAVGSSFLYVAERARFSIEPLICTDSLVYDHNNPDNEGPVPPTAWIRSFEYQGTQDRSAQTAIATALSLREVIGEEVIRDHMQTLRGQIRQHMTKRGLACFSPDHPDLASAMVTCLIPKTDRIAAWKWFRAKGFEVGFPQWKKGQTIMRLSAAWFVEAENIEEFFALYDQFSASIQS